MALSYNFTITVKYVASGATNVPSQHSASKGPQSSPFATVSTKVSSTRPSLGSNYNFAYWTDQSGTRYNPGDTISWEFDDDTTFTWDSHSQGHASHTFTLTAHWYSVGGKIKVVNSAGTGLDDYRVYIVNSAGTGLDKYRVYIVNSAGTGLDRYD